MKKIITFLTILMLSCAGIFAQEVDGDIPDGASFVFDGLEKGNYWIWAGFDWHQYGDFCYASGANISREWASEGSHSLEMTIDEMPPDAKKAGIWFYDGTNDLSGSKYMVMDFYNPEDITYYIDIAIQATSGWNWCDLGSFALPKGEHYVVLSMEKFTERLYDVKRVLIYNNTAGAYPKDAHFFVDNIRLIK